MKRKLLLILILFSAVRSWAQTPLLQYTNIPNQPTSTVAERVPRIANLIKKKEVQMTANKGLKTDSVRNAKGFKPFDEILDVKIWKNLNLSENDLTLASKELSSSSVAQYLSLSDLKDSLRLASDTASQSNWLRKIGTYKLAYTYEFLSHYQVARQYHIWDLGNYEIDTLNKFFYNQKNVSALQNAYVQESVDPATYINAEFASFLFGPVRLGVGGTFKSSGDTSKDNAMKTSLNKIISNGGAISFNFSLPLLFTRDRLDQIHFGVFAQINNGINPNINDSTGATSYSTNILYVNQSGFRLHFDAGSNDQKAKIMVELPVYYSWGSNNTYQQLGVADYTVVKLQVGVVVSNLVSLYISGPLWSTSETIKKIPFGLSLQFSPAQLAGGK